MLVHQSNRSCNCCGNTVETSIVDLPLEEVKLAPFAIACDCGYFYEAYHYAVSFRKWRIAKGKIEHRLEDAQSEYNREKEFIDTIASSAYRLIELERLEKKVISLHAEWDDISLTPTPDYAWVD